MAELSQTPGSVVKGTPAGTIVATSGEAITAGMAVYFKTSDSRWWKASATTSAATSGSDGLGIALSSAPGAGQQFVVWTSGRINVGATLTIGEVYCVSRTTGGAISLYSDLITGDFPAVLGLALSASILQAPSDGTPFATGVAKG